jgi:hypothetical protein
MFLGGDCEWYPADGKRIGLVILVGSTAQESFSSETFIAQFQLSQILSQFLSIRGPSLTWAVH